MKNRASVVPCGIAIPILVFITGGELLVLEVVATRLLSPFYGNTLVTVSSVIGTTLGALSAGYYFGGRVADDAPSLAKLSWVVLIAGVAQLVSYYLSSITLAAVSTHATFAAGALASSIMLIAAPAFALGMVSPIAVKLQSLSAQNAVGRATGSVLFWSTLGSIAGCLSTGFLLIPMTGVRHIVIGGALTLVVLGLLGLSLGGRRSFVATSAALGFVVLVLTLPKAAPDADVIFERDGHYSRLVIREGARGVRPVRFLEQDNSHAGATYLDSRDPRDLVYEYGRYYLLQLLVNTPVRNALVIGGGVYSLPEAMLVDFPSANVHVAEIEPGLFELAKRYFGATDSPRLLLHHEDGRRFLREAVVPFDLIFGDAFYSRLSTPPHLTTLEFYHLAKQRLGKDGVMMVNLSGSLRNDAKSFTWSEIRTFRSVFENSLVFAVRSATTTGLQNIMLVGRNGSGSLHSELMERGSSIPILNLAAKIVDISPSVLERYTLLTDDYSPVEALTLGELSRMRR